MTNIAIIEDDQGLNNGIAMALKQEDFRFYQYASLAEAKDVKEMDLIILDINLPDGNGFDFLKKLRTHSDVPVIILTANDLETDEVMGLNLGADDYMTKPFSLMVLRARIEKILQKRNSHQAVYRFGDMELDFDKMIFQKNGQSVELSKTEQKLLKILVENRNMTMQRDVLLDKVWTDGAEYVDENALSVTIKRLRDKLETKETKYIQTVYGVGYVWKV
ncbi:MAG: response regulator transcription factor [Lachnospiraceae bacterium]|nr:response regulator transcription factor [Lachnospiraceae bacterium]